LPFTKKQFEESDKKAQEKDKFSPLSLFLLKNTRESSPKISLTILPLGCSQTRNSDDG